MLRPIRTQHGGKDVVLVCLHWRTFPAALAEIAQEQGVTPDQIRAKKILGEDGYQRYLIWERICGQMEMKSEVCLKCEHANTMEQRDYLPCLVSLDGKRVIPSTDLPTMDALPRHRGHRSIHQGGVRRRGARER